MTNTQADVERLTPLAALELVCGDLFDRWDKDQRSGKLLSALSGMMSPGYDPRVDLIRTALASIGVSEPSSGEGEAKPVWRCFHCDEVFTSERCARLHFGRNEDSEAACVIKAGAEGSLLKALRHAEEAADDAIQAMHAESTDAAKAYHAQRARHSQTLIAAEELGYERGLADGRALTNTVEGDAVPADWVLVPREPTEAMLTAGIDAWIHDRELTFARRVWSAMLTASPTVTGVGASSGEVPVWQLALDEMEEECRELRAFIKAYIAAWEAGTGTVYLIDRARALSAFSPLDGQEKGK